MTKLEKLKKAVREGYLEVMFGDLDRERGWVTVRSTRTGRHITTNKEY